MRPAGRLLVAIAAAALADAAVAAAAQQPPPGPDSIGDMLRGGATDPAEPDTAAGGSRVDPDPPAPPVPNAYAHPPAPRLSRPVYLDETGRNPDAPPSPAERAYDGRLRSSAASAQGFQGPMDGGWTLSGNGRDLYAFQLIDRGGVVEGAWRDLRRPGALDASGFIDAVARTGADMTFRFSGGVVAVLRADAGGWSGELTEAGRTEPVNLARRAP